MRDSVLAGLSGIELFSSLAPEEIQPLLARIQRRTYRADETIFREGDPPSFIYYILSGDVSLSLASEDKRITIAKLGPGDLVGVLAIFDDGPQFYSATALTPATLIAVPKVDVLMVLRRHPETLLRMGAILAQQIRAAAVMVADMQFLDLPVRLAKRILELADQPGAIAGNNGAVTVTITQEELSELTGATRGGVNRALKRLEHLGIVRTGRGRVVVLDPDRLRQLAQQGPLPLLLAFSRV